MALDDVAEHLLLPTPVAQPSGNTPEEHLRKKPGREVVTDLAIITENGLLETGERLLPTPRATDGPKGGPNQRGSSGDMMPPSAVQQFLPTPRATRGGSGTETMYLLGAERSDDDRPQGQVLLPTPTVGNAEGTNERRGGSRGDELLLPGAAKAMQIAWGPYEPAIRRWEAVLGRPAPAPTEPNAKGNHRLSPRFTEWMMGVPEGWITGLVTHKGISRNEQLKAAGNGVVPAQAAAALRDMLQAFGGTEIEENAA